MLVVDGVGRDFGIACELACSTDDQSWCDETGAS